MKRLPLLGLLAATSLSGLAHAQTISAPSGCIAGVPCAASTLNLSGTLTAADGGTWGSGGINGSIIGGTTAEAGTFTTLTATSSSALKGDVVIGASSNTSLFANGNASFAGAVAGGTFYGTSNGANPVTVGGSGGVVFGAGSVRVASAQALQFSTDTSLSRISAGIIGVGTGAQGSVAGGLQAATLALGGATIGANALAVTGTSNFSSTLAVAPGATINTSTIAATSTTPITVTGGAFGASASLIGGANSNAASPGGNALVTGGAGTGTGASNGGNVVLSGGASTNGTAGNVLSTNLFLGGYAPDTNALGVTGNVAVNGNITATGSGAISSATSVSANTFVYGVTRLAVGSGGSSITSPTLNTIHFGLADVTTGASPQIVGFQGNTAATTTGPTATIQGAGGGSGAGSLGGLVNIVGGLTSAAAGGGGAVSLSTAPPGAGNAPITALFADNVQHITAGNTTNPPTCGTGCASLSGASTDQRMTITTGTAVSAITVNFGKTWINTPVCTVTDNSVVAIGSISAISTSAVTITTASALTAAPVYLICG